MGWQISCLENTVEVNNKIAEELFEVDQKHQQRWWDLAEIMYNNNLHFNPDDMEHMDYLWDDDYNTVLKNHKVKGRVCFGSLDGDNAGEFWGYEFNGKGDMKKIEGTLNWE